MLAIKVRELNDNVSNLALRDQTFARSLIRQFNSKGSLSAKQAPWVERLLERANGTDTQQEPHETEEVGSFQGLMALFMRAAQHLKRPAIVLQIDGFPVRMSLGIKGQGKGSVNITDGGPYGRNKWYGRVSPEGVWTKSRARYEEEGKIRELIEAMANDPAKTAHEHGRLTGRCCFCNQGLKDEKSTDVGYGPICAKHYGLPWGNKRRGA